MQKSTYIYLSYDLSYDERHTTFPHDVVSRETRNARPITEGEEKKKKSGGPVTLQTVFSCLRICLFVLVFAFQRIRFLREVASFGEIRGSQ